MFALGMLLATSQMKPSPTAALFLRVFAITCPEFYCMSRLTVAPPASFTLVSQPRAVRLARRGRNRLDGLHPRTLPRPASRTMVAPCAAHPLREAGKRVAQFHATLTAPLQKTSPSREFTIALLGFTAYNLHRNFTFAKVLTSAGFILWPRMVQRVCANRPVLQQVGLQAFNIVLVRGNPCGVMLAMAACYSAHRLTTHLPAAAHQGVRTLAFWGALIGGARFNRVLWAKT